MDGFKTHSWEIFSVHKKSCGFSILFSPWGISPFMCVMAKCSKFFVSSVLCGVILICTTKRLIFFDMADKPSGHKLMVSIICSHRAGSAGCN